MKRLKWYKLAAMTIAIVLVGWLALTFWVEADGPKRSWTFGEGSSLGSEILIVYDPDPFYNLDEQLCRAFAKALSDSGFHGMVATVSAARELKNGNFKAYVLCANTYNWRPDWSITSFIKKDIIIKDKPVIALTVGSGSTEWSQANFEKIIRQQHGKLIDSKSFWLMRPNDESRTGESNSNVAQSVVYYWATQKVDDLRKFVIH